MYFFGAFRGFPSGSYIMWTFIKSIRLNLGLKINYTQSYRKYLLSSWSSSLYSVLYKTYDMFGLVKTDLTVCYI